MIARLLSQHQSNLRFDRGLNRFKKECIILPLMSEGEPPLLYAECPQCDRINEKLVRLDLRAAGNVTVLQCLDCDWEFAKNQSVKIPGNLVRHAAEAMNIHEGYSSLGEYVRDCVRRMNEQHMREANAAEFSTFMGAIGENPEIFAKMIEAVEEDE